MEAKIKPPYARAPIQEAVMQLQFGNLASVEELQRVSRSLQDVYPNETPQTALEFAIDTTGGQVQVSKEESPGFQRRSDDQADVAILTPNSVAVSRLAPYQSWEHLKAFGERVWQDWYRFTKVTALSRVGVRYINRLDIPLDATANVEIEKYILVRPHVPDSCNKGITAYLIQVEAPTSTPNWSVRLTTSSVPPPTIGYLSILLDIDIFRISALPRRQDEVIAMIDEARAVKNEIFEACMTDASRALFK